MLYGDTFDASMTAHYAELRKVPGNICISPANISIALAMMAEGAVGSTSTQMKTVLGLPPGVSVCDALANRGTPIAATAQRGYELAMANALWTQTGLQVSPTYRKRIQQTFRANVLQADYAGDPAGSCNSINDWISNRTHQKIQGLLPEGSLGAETRVVLTNATYFQGSWQEPFDRKDTEDAPFTLLDGTTTTVPLMTRTGGTHDYFEDEQVQVIRLAYRGGEISFMAVLPKDATRFSDWESGVSAASIAHWVKNLKSTTDVSVWLPRFKVESSNCLNEPLMALGMPDAFRAGVADFSGVATGERLSISTVQHKAYLDVNEEGTEAAAATGSIMYFNGGAHFHAHRPFLFALRHEPTGTLLFLGRLTSP